MADFAAWPESCEAGCVWEGMGRGWRGGVGDGERAAKLEWSD